MGDAAASYDANGNLLSDGLYTYSYDSENRWLGATSPDRSAQLRYHPNGRLLQTGPIHDENDHNLSAYVGNDPPSTPAAAVLKAQCHYAAPKSWFSGWHRTSLIGLALRLPYPVCRSIGMGGGVGQDALMTRLIQQTVSAIGCSLFVPAW